MATGAAAHPAAPGVTARYSFLDGCRGLAALFVVLHHFSVTWTEFRVLFGAAPLAVDFFFSLSGFVIAHAYETRLRSGMTTREYLLRRLVRLYPMYFVGGVLGLAGVAALKLAGLTDFTWRAVAEATVLHLLYIPFFNGYTEQLFDDAVRGTLFPLNNPAWSLFFELVFASTLFVVAARFRAAAAWFAALGAIALVVAAYRYGATPGYSAWNIAGGLPRVVFAFFSGVLIHQHRLRLARLRPARPWVVLAALCVLFVMPRGPGFLEYWLLSALVGVPMLVAAASTAEIRTGWARQLADYGGRLSYPLYCVHYPLLMLLAAAGWRPSSYAAAMAMFVALSIVCAHVAMVAFDEPLRRRLGERMARSWRGPAAQPARR